MKELKIFINLTRLNRPIGYLLLFWPCSWGLAYAYLDNQNINVVACVLSIFPKWQIWNRNNFKNYKQIYLYSPISFLVKSICRLRFESSILSLSAMPKFPTPE